MVRRLFGRARGICMTEAMLLTAILLTGAPSGDPEQAPPDLANPMCPVMPAEEADDVFHLVYKGRDVHFCCSTCIQYFRKNPKKYLSRLKQFDGWQTEDPTQVSGGLAAGEGGTGGGGAGGAPVLHEVWMGALMAGDLIPFFALLIPGFGLLAFRRRRLTAATAGLFVLVAALGVSTSFARHAYDLYNLWKDRDRVHFATFFEFGHPPAPARPDGQPKSLTSRYYRGNDERNPALFNNGYYRTSTFDLVLEDEAGAPVRPGDDVGGKRLYVRLDTLRAPNTAGRFFHRKAMEPIFLTRLSDPFLGAHGPIPDRVGWTEVKEAWHWQARYPIGQVNPARSGGPTLDLQTATADQIAAQPGVGAVAARWFVKYREFNGGIGSTADLIEAGIEGVPLKALSELLDSEQLEGVVYVAQLIPKGDDLSNIRGSRFHFGLVYDVRLRGGRVQPDSDLWMNYLYRSRKTAAWRIPTTEWFDNKPIPEIPDDQAKVTDPVLLGLQDSDQGLIPAGAH